MNKFAPAVAESETPAQKKERASFPTAEDEDVTGHPDSNTGEVIFSVYVVHIYIN